MVGSLTQVPHLRLPAAGLLQVNWEIKLIVKATKYCNRRVYEVHLFAVVGYEEQQSKHVYNNKVSGRKPTTTGTSHRYLTGQ